jgi:hypothetical protein
MASSSLRSHKKLNKEWEPSRQRGVVACHVSKTLQDFTARQHRRRGGRNHRWVLHGPPSRLSFLGPHMSVRISTPEDIFMMAPSSQIIPILPWRLFLMVTRESIHTLSFSWFLKSHRGERILLARVPSSRPSRSRPGGGARWTPNRRHSSGWLVGDL